MVKHKYSIEKLVHYQCGACDRWWSIGDGPASRILTCPWCAWSAECTPCDEPEPCGDGREPEPESVSERKERLAKINADLQKLATMRSVEPCSNCGDDIAPEECPVCGPESIRPDPNPWETHTGSQPPSDLAPAQMVNALVMAEDDDENEAIPANCVAWPGVRYYRPLLDPDGLPYVSAEGLEPWAKYVATDHDGVVFQYYLKPKLVENRLFWQKTVAAMNEAPDTHRIPGDWRQSLAKVWREG